MKNSNANISRSLDDFESICKARGIRVTHQRLEIYKVLLMHTDHPTTDNIFKQVRKHLKTISIDTVYRTIAMFEEYGLLKRVHHIDNTTRFDTNISNHHHLICSNCNKIEDFNWPDFDRMKPPKSISGWSNIEIKHVVIDGLCTECRNKTISNKR